MSLSGLTCNPAKFSSTVTSKLASCSRSSQVSAASYNQYSNGRMKHLSHSDRYCRLDLAYRYRFQQTHKVKSAMDASFGDISGDSTEIFPRTNIRDPYKRLGISREASEEEIQAARNFLVHKYAGHKPSVDVIESAHDKILMQSFHDRRKPKINIKKRARELTQSRVVKAVTSRFEAPATRFLIMTSIAFWILGVLTVLFPTKEGPTLQVAISLIASIYFICDRLKIKIRAFLYGIGAFFGSWLLGTFLMVSVIPPLLHGPRSLEVMTLLISYVLLWVASTYLKWCSLCYAIGHPNFPSGRTVFLEVIYLTLCWLYQWRLYCLCFSLCCGCNEYCHCCLNSPGDATRFISVFGRLISVQEFRKSFLFGRFQYKK